MKNQNLFLFKTTAYIVPDLYRNFVDKQVLQQSSLLLINLQKKNIQATFETLSRTCTEDLITSMHGTLRLQLRIRTKILKIALLWAIFSQHSGDSLVATSETIKGKQIDKRKI